MFRPVVYFLAAKAISDVGFALDFIAVGAFVWMRTGSPLATGALLALQYGGGIVGGRITHVFGDRWDRRRAMIGADLVRLAMLVVLAALPDAWQILWLYPTTFVIGTGRSVFEATLGASLPAMAGGRLQVANSIVSGLRGAALVAGMALAAVATKAVGFRGLFAADAITYGVSAWALAALPLRFREEAPARARAAPASAQPWWVVLGPALIALLAVRTLDALGSGSHHVGLPILGARLDPSDAARALGLLWMTWAAGTVAGSFGLRPLLTAPLATAPALAFFLATAGMSSGFIGIFWIAPWAGKLASAFGAGLGDSISEIAFRQAFQQVPERSRGGMFGLAHMTINAGFIAGMLVSGALIAPGTVPFWVLVLHGVPLLASLAGALASLRSAAARPAALGAEGR